MLGHFKSMPFKEQYWELSASISLVEEIIPGKEGVLK
jgi:hypothetical protein